MPFDGALVRKAADQTAANYTASTALAWDSETYDTAGYHEGVTNPSRLTVPSGVSKVRLNAGLRLDLISANLWVFFALRKNGNLVFDGAASSSIENGLTSRNLCIQSPVLEVTPGDYFEVVLQVETDTSISVIAARSWFAIEKVE